MINILGIILLLLSLINLVAISVLIYFKKDNWAISLAILEIFLIYYALNYGLK